MCRPSAAWSFTVSASQTCQSLGLHSAVSMSKLSAGTRQENLRLFWAVYMTDKLLSLRLGRSSTIRDGDISVPRMPPDDQDGLWRRPNPTLPALLEMSSLHGRIYDEIYGPNALLELQEARVAKARALASDVIRFTNDGREAAVRSQQHTRVRSFATTLTWVQKYHHDERQPVLGDLVYSIFHRLEIVHNMSLLTLIYRAMPAENPSEMVFSQECIAAARAALETHEACVSSLVDRSLSPDIVETFISW
jgi:hypothetical protein